MNVSYCSFVQKPMTGFDDCSVVPGTIKEDHFTGRGKVSDVALEVPLPSSVAVGFGSAAILAPLGFRCSVKRWMVPAFAGCITSFKNNDKFFAFLLNP